MWGASNCSAGLSLSLRAASPHSAGVTPPAHPIHADRWVAGLSCRHNPVQADRPWPGPALTCMMQTAPASFTGGLKMAHPSPQQDPWARRPPLQLLAAPKRPLFRAGLCQPWEGAPGPACLLSSSSADGGCPGGGPVYLWQTLSPG